MENSEKTRVPRQKRSIQTRDQIIETAMRLFSQKGFYQTSSNEISEQAGVSIGSFYAYFKDKKQLFIEVLKYYDKQILDRIHIEKKPDNGNKEEFLRGLINRLLQSHKIFPEFHKELSAMQLLDPDIKKVIDEQELLVLEYTRQSLKIWQDQIKTTDLEAAAFVVYSAIEKVVHALTFSDVAIEEERLVNELVNMILKYLF